MPADAINYGKLAVELNECLSNGRIDKIIMSDKTTLVLNIRARGKNNSLIITAAASPRCFITSDKIKSTDIPLAFCLHLRRHIAGGMINSVNTLPFERIIEIKITARGDLGELKPYTMFIEIMGKYSNVVLTDENGKITDSLKHVGFEESHPVMPGLIFTPPRDETRYDPVDERADALAFSCDKEELPAVMIKKLRGLSAATAAEIAYTAASCGCGLSEACSRLLARPTQAVVYYRDNKPVDFSFCDYGSASGERKIFPSICEAMDEYYSATCKQDELSVVSATAKKAISSALTKQKKKLAGFEHDLISAADYEKERILGELITANIYKIKKGDDCVIADNWYEGGQTVIKLTENSPQEDAQKHFKKYQKKKRTVSFLNEQKADAERTIDYLESVDAALSCARTVSDVEAIIEELEDEGYIRNTNKRGKKTVSEPRKYDIDGFTVLVGKSNIQNDRITKEARGDDIWLHTQGFHGSHVIIRTHGKDVPHDVLLRAASLAAFFSKARLSENVPVDYTRVKDVHKKRGAAPGKVDYFGAKTIYVTPEAPNAE